MTRIFHDADAPLDAVTGNKIVVVGYGNQGRAWAQNLRDSGLDVRVGTVSDASRAERFAGIDLKSGMRTAIEEISSGAFAREWAGVRAEGYRRMKEVREAEGRDALMDFEDEVPRSSSRRRPSSR
ncbi:MAG: hypothetical protein ACXVP8_06300 [Actinomycetota bacterium]